MTPSSRFRVRQHLNGLAQLGVVVHEFTPIIQKYQRIPCFPAGLSQKWTGPIYPFWLTVKWASRLPGILGSWGHQITWLERNLLPGLYTTEFALKQPLVFDVDDAIWTDSDRSYRSARKIASNAKAIIAGNQTIARWFSQWNSNVFMIPTAVDTVRFRPPESTKTGAFRIGWIGTSSNLRFLEAIGTPLRRFLTENPTSQLVVVCDQRPNFDLGPQLVFVPWSEKSEVDLVQSFSVGLMPLEDSSWAQGKCAFKMLQYMACGVSVVASPVGVNAEILRKDKPGLSASTDEEWYRALTMLKRNPDLAHRYGRSGRKTVVSNYSLEAITPQIADVFISLKTTH